MRDNIEKVIARERCRCGFDVGEKPMTLEAYLKHEDNVLYYLTMLRDLAAVCRKHGWQSIYGINLPAVGEVGPLDYSDIDEVRKR